MSLMNTKLYSLQIYTKINYIINNFLKVLKWNRTNDESLAIKRGR